MVLAWVDRFNTRTIRARLAENIEGDFDPESEVVIYKHGAADNAVGQDTGSLLADMSIWSFGLPYAEALPDGDVLVVYYAGTKSAMDTHWALLRINRK